MGFLDERKTYLARLVTVILTVILLSCLLPACQRPAAAEVGRGFYYWKSVFALSPSDLRYLDSVGVDRLYVKFFDVVWERERERPVPAATVSFATSVPAALEIIPTIYITNETLLHTPDELIGDLADRLGAKVEDLLTAADLSLPAEVQLDCDWTGSTRDKYFVMLRVLRSRWHSGGPVLSATIRLHQIKYADRTGVPPVDRGMLMCYNLQSPAERSVRNAVLDPEVAEDYLGRLDAYPLPLDVALPLYSWGALFAGDEFSAMIANLRAADLANISTFRRRKGNLYEVLADTVLKGVRVHRGDLLRLDEARPADCRRVAKLLADRLKGAPRHLALFHYDAEVLEGFGRASIPEIFAALR